MCKLFPGPWFQQHVPGKHMSSHWLCLPSFSPQSSSVSSEVGRAVWLRFSPPLPSSGPQPSFMAHLSGAVVGISMGLLILRSYEESLQKQCSWWVIVFSFITFLLFAIFWNIFAYELLGVQIPPPPWYWPPPTPSSLPLHTHILPLKLVPHEMI